MAKKADVKLIEITIWLGLNSRMRIRADEDDSLDLPDRPMHYLASGATMGGDPAILALMQRIVEKISNAFPTQESIKVEVSGKKLV